MQRFGGCARVCRRFLALAVLGLGACAPTRYYTLAVRAPLRREAAPGVPVSVADVILPPGLNQLALTSFRSGTHVRVSRRARWVRSPEKLCREVLAEDLAQRLSETVVVLPGQRAPTPLRTLHVVIDRFVPSGSDTVVLRAHWFVSGSLAGPVGSADGTARIVLTGALTTLTEAHVMSEALAHLASQISVRLARASQSGIPPLKPLDVPRDTVF